VHPWTAEFVHFFAFPTGARPDLGRLRASAIKAQIMQGLGFVYGMEIEMSVRELRAFEPVEHPFPNLSDLR